MQSLFLPNVNIICVRPYVYMSHVCYLADLNIQLQK
jgi:hypothetical protein